MTWTIVLVLAAGAYVFKLVGYVGVGQRTVSPVVERCLGLIPAAMVAALIAKDTFAVGRDLVIDARVAGIAAAAVAVWRRAPFVVVVLVAASVTAAVRALG